MTRTHIYLTHLQTNHPFTYPMHSFTHSSDTYCTTLTHIISFIFTLLSKYKRTQSHNLIHQRTLFTLTYSLSISPTSIQISKHTLLPLPPAYTNAPTHTLLSYPLSSTLFHLLNTHLPLPLPPILTLIPTNLSYPISSFIHSHNLANPLTHTLLP
jgi:hypothetical protein